MKKLLNAAIICLFIYGMYSCEEHAQNDDFLSFAQSRKTDLQLGVYITAHTVQEQFSTEAGCREAISVLRCNGFSKVYV